MDYKKIIAVLNQELTSKKVPGPILDEIMLRRLEVFSKEIELNHNLLMIGAILGDIRIDEAKLIGKKEAHVQMALDYAEKVYKKYSFPNGDREIVNEIIATHHGGEQKYIESKVYKNADNFKFLEPRGCFHFFGAIYTKFDAEGLNNAVSIVKDKLRKKLDLTDLNTKTIKEAQELYQVNVNMLDKILSTHKH